MSINTILRILLIIIVNITLLVTGCSSNTNKSRGHANNYHQKTDSYPSRIPKNILHIPNATPKVEPKSKYGNPTSYVVFNKRYQVLPSSAGYKAKGAASWYGTKFHGYRTSSGELYDMYKMTAAHKTLPLPTYVQVKNIDNGKTVIVKVNDRGPFHDNRILDLSYAAAAKLDILKKGTGKIEITAIDPKSRTTKYYASADTTQQSEDIVNEQVHADKTLSLNNINTIQYSTTDETLPIYRYLQVGAFHNKENAESLRNKILQLANSDLQVHIQTSSSQELPIFRVRIGPIDDPTVLNDIKNNLLQANLPTPIAIP